MLNRREFAIASASALALGGLGRSAYARPESQLPVEDVAVDLRHEIGALDHLWSRCAGSDRAQITMREGWRRDAGRMRNETGLQRVRFHGILDDEMGVWPKPLLPIPARVNFQNVDVVYDGLLDLGLEPWVEISFMPGELASGEQTFGLYKGNVTPPKSSPEWGGFVRQFAQHLIGRYGAPVVRNWYFEVWNEPNLPYFWSGTQRQYFDFYRVTATALKAVDPALKVGGPATSSAQWISEFLDYCGRTAAPLDFVSTHLYAGDDQTRIFGEAKKYSQNDIIPAGMARVRAQIDATPFKGSELWLSEWSSDSPAMIAHVIKHCMPYCHGMSHWELSGVYEEIMVLPWILKDNETGWGLFAPRNIPMPGFNTYKLLNRLGHRQLSTEGPALASRFANGKATVLVWNLAAVTQAKGIPGVSSVRKVVGDRKQLSVRLNGARPGQRVRVSYVDWERGSPFPAWHALGSPQYMTRQQLAQVRAAAEIPAAEIRRLDADGKLALELPPEGIALLEID